MKSFLIRAREKFFHTGRIIEKLDSIEAKLANRATDHAATAPFLATAALLPDINNVLHDSRSAFLRDMPRVGGTIMSAGCAGTWYFNWVASRTTHAARHIGIEFYSEKPDDLPGNVDWIANTVGNMTGVKDGECDLVFSGENLEHLWPEDVVGFFLESARVLKPGAWLIVDSPNRIVTEPLNWSHPEHTIEFTPDEVRRLAELSGFEVTAMKGIWICRDPDTGKILPLNPSEPVENWPAVERCVAATSHPDDSLIWWMEARKTGEPRPAELKQAVDTIFESAWVERSRRFLTVVGSKSADKNSFVADKGISGVLVYGPYMPLKAGMHSATFTISVGSQTAPGSTVARCDIIGLKGQELAVRDITAGELAESKGTVRLDIELAELEFGIQARCISTGAAHLTCALPIIV